MKSEIEIYWNGRAFDFEGNMKEPFDELHDAWLQAHSQGLRVTGVKVTPAGHEPRPYVAPPEGE